MSLMEAVETILNMFVSLKNVTGVTQNLGKYEISLKPHITDLRLHPRFSGTFYGLVNKSLGK